MNALFGAYLIIYEFISGPDFSMFLPLPLLPFLHSLVVLGFLRECLSTACETMRRQITLRAFNGCK